MLPPLAATWVPTAVGVASAALVMLVMWLAAGRPGRGGPDETDPGSDGGWGSTPPPRRPPPAGPVCWPEFERQFAAYVARDAERRASRAGRARDAGGDRAARRAGAARRDEEIGRLPSR
jgi:hypothetical protein